MQVTSMKNLKEIMYYIDDRFCTDSHVNTYSDVDAQVEERIKRVGLLIAPKTRYCTHTHGYRSQVVIPTTAIS